MKNLGFYTATFTGVFAINFATVSIFNNVHELPANAKNIEVFFHTSSSATQTTAFNSQDNLHSNLSSSNKYKITNFNTPTSSQASTQYKKLLIPYDNLENFKKYTFCADNSSSCKSQSQISDNDEILANIAFYFLNIQHSLYLLKTLIYYDNHSQLKSTNSIFTTTYNNCNNCASHNNNNKKCCFLSSATEISADDDKKNFYLSLSNLSASNSDEYFGPIQLHLFMNNISTLANNNASQKVSGFLIYDYFDYYYQRKKSQNLHQIKNEYTKIKKTNSSTEEYYVTNFLCLTYEIDNKKIKNKTYIDNDKSDITYVYSKLSNKQKLLKQKNISYALKEIIACRSIGKITKSNLSSISSNNEYCC